MIKASQPSNKKIVYDFLLENEGKPFSIYQICQALGMAKSSVASALQNLINKPIGKEVKRKESMNHLHFHVGTLQNDGEMLRRPSESHFRKKNVRGKSIPEAQQDWRSYEAEMRRLKAEERRMEKSEEQCL